MKFSRSQIDKAGETIMSSKVGKEYDAAMNKISEWRKLHLPALDALKDEIDSLLKGEGITNFSISRRLKRISSILYKLDVNDKMRLGGMQDIGGMRTVFTNIGDLKNAFQILSKWVPKNFEFVGSRDYISEPKESGYRSIHFMYKYKSDDKDLDGARVELQIRTKLQHSWAMAVETAGLLTNTSLKSSMGSDEWLIFFRIVSCLFAIKEKCQYVKEYREQSIDMRGLMRLFSKLDSKYKLIDTLMALRVTAQYAEGEEFQNGYYILNIDFVNRKVKIDSFSKEQEDEASIKYSELEEDLRCENCAVVLVSVPKIKELRTSYQSYFLDTKEFIEILETIKSNCQRID